MREVSNTPSVLSAAHAARMERALAHIASAKTGGPRLDNNWPAFGYPAAIYAAEVLGEETTGPLNADLAYALYLLDAALKADRERRWWQRPNRLWVGRVDHARRILERWVNDGT